MLTHSVCCEEAAGNPYNLFAAPPHDQTWILCHHSDTCRLQIFCIRIIQKSRDILGSQHDRHTFLGLGDRKFRTIQPLILLRNGIKIDRQPIRKLTDCHGDTACTEVVAALDQTTDLGIAEKALQLAFRRRIALLYLRSRSRQRLLCMLLGRTSRTADAVTPRAPAKQDDDIAGHRALTHNLCRRHCADHCTDLHTLCKIALMVNLTHLARGKTDLVAVGTVSLRCAKCNLLLRELPWQRILDWCTRIGGSSHAHRLIDIGTP